jgi:hypothetical protein
LLGRLFAAKFGKFGKLGLIHGLGVEFLDRARGVVTLAKGWLNSIVTILNYRKLNLGWGKAFGHQS